MTECPNFYFLVVTRLIGTEYDRCRSAAPPLGGVVRGDEKTAGQAGVERSYGMAEQHTDAETRQDRFARGFQVLGEVNGETGDRFLESLADIAPEMGHQVVAWAYGEIYSRPGLASRDRQLMTLGILTALGGCEPQLEIHVDASLNVGLEPWEIVEALLHSAVYCGFPKALNATAVAKKVFAERGLLPVAAEGRTA
jgi:4-carboxymuconolactone decarboxylase